MTYRGYIKNGAVTFDELSRLPEGTKLQIEVEDRLPFMPRRAKLRKFVPIQLPGDSLADQLVRDRR